MQTHKYFRSGDPLQVTLATQLLLLCLSSSINLMDSSDLLQITLNGLVHEVGD